MHASSTVRSQRRSRSELGGDRQRVDALVPGVVGREDRAAPSRPAAAPPRGRGGDRGERRRGRGARSRHRRGISAAATLRLDPRRRRRRARIARADLVDEGGESCRRSPASWISSTFSAFFSPGAREVELADEGDVVGDDDLRVHEVVHGVRRPRRRRLARERRPPRARVAGAGSSSSLTPFVAPLVEDLVDLRLVDRRRPRRSASRPTISTSVPRIGPELSTGEAIRIRRRAWPSSFAIRCESASPCSGVNHGAHLDAADVDRPRLDVAGAARRPPSPTAPRS